jgi:NADH-quinone oxidoreductase subunit N
MTALYLSDLIPVLPELLLAVGSLVFLLVGVFAGRQATTIVSSGVVALMVAALALVSLSGAVHWEVFSGLFVTDGFTRYMKMLVLAASGFSIIMSRDYLRDQKLELFEFPVLILLATLGMLMMISANSMMSLYLGLELQSLSLYVLAAIRRDSEVSSEAGLKYFVLGALSSGMLLYGISLIYGFTGTTNFDVLYAVIGEGHGHLSFGLIFGLVFLTAGFAFKMSAVPFHMWTPDVYEGAPTPVTAFFAVGPKIAALALFTRILFVPFAGAVADWQQIVIFLAIASTVLGAVAAIVQTNIKRLMAYSSIGHVGFALIALAAGTKEGISGLLIYLTIYLAMNIGAFVVILHMKRGDERVEEISDLAGLARTRPMLAAAMAIFMFSLAGVPWMAGFFGKLYVFLAAVHAHLYALATIGVLASVVGAYYYLRIIKVMYFDEPTGEIDQPLGLAMGTILAATAGFTLLFVFYPMPLVESAQVAAAALLP